jgi:hypothetical protein
MPSFLNCERRILDLEYTWMMMATSSPPLAVRRTVLCTAEFESVLFFPSFRTKSKTLGQPRASSTFWVFQAGLTSSAFVCYY